jgi:hypothetical protein
MAYEDMESGEKAPSITTALVSKNMTLKEAIGLGEYNPDFLATFPEWHTYSRHIQFQYIRQALDNRNKQLLMQWAEINNTIDFRLKPQMAEALVNIQKQMKKLDDERDKLYFEYSK